LPGDTPDLKDAGSEGTQSKSSGHILHRAAPKVKTQTLDEREAEDLDVAKFYQNSGDLQGAYARTQDAVKIAPDDPEAHFALAGLAAKMGRKEEAIAEYNACLKLDPTDKQKKESSKAIARLAK
jgi:Flp pilus assembly protein TadD